MFAFLLQFRRNSKNTIFAVIVVTHAISSCDGSNNENSSGQEAGAIQNVGNTFFDDTVIETGGDSPQFVETDNTIISENEFFTLRFNDRNGVQIEILLDPGSTAESVEIEESFLADEPGGDNFVTNGFISLVFSSNYDGRRRARIESVAANPSVVIYNSDDDSIEPITFDRGPDAKLEITLPRESTQVIFAVLDNLQ